MRTRLAAAFLAVFTLVASIVSSQLHPRISERLAWWIVSVMAVVLFVLAFMATSAPPGPTPPPNPPHLRGSGVSDIAASLRTTVSEIARRSSGSPARLILTQVVRIPLALLAALLAGLARVMAWWARQSPDRQVSLVRRGVVTGYSMVAVFFAWSLVNGTADRLIGPRGNADNGWSMEQTIDWQVDGISYEAHVVTRGRTGSVDVTYTGADGAERVVRQDLSLRKLEVGFDERWGYVGANPRSGPDGLPAAGYSVDTFLVDVSWGRATGIDRVCDQLHHSCFEAHPN